MASTYNVISTYTTTSSTASYTFSSIPATYTNLVLIAAGGTVGAAGSFGLQFNGDTGTNYSWTALYGTGSVAGSNRGSNSSYAYILGDNMGYGSGTTTIANINGYSNTTTYKTIIARSSYAQGEVTAWADLWRSTSAINAIKINGVNANIDSGVTFTLYGIKAA